MVVAVFVWEAGKGGKEVPKQVEESNTDGGLPPSSASAIPIFNSTLPAPPKKSANPFVPIVQAPSNCWYMGNDCRQRWSAPHTLSREHALTMKGVSEKRMEKVIGQENEQSLCINARARQDGNVTYTRHWDRVEMGGREERREGGRQPTHLLDILALPSLSRRHRHCPLW